jgi:hypothetical protein
MARVYRLKIGDVYLTKTGLVDGIPCELSISGASDLLNTFSGSVTPAIDGTPIVQVFETGTKGKVLEIKVTRLYTAVWQSLVELIQTSLSEGETINLIGTGDIGNFDVDCFPFLPKPFEANEFSNGRIENAVFRFITV